MRHDFGTALYRGPGAKRADSHHETFVAAQYYQGMIQKLRTAHFATKPRQHGIGAPLPNGKAQARRKQP